MPRAVARDTPQATAVDVLQDAGEAGHEMVVVLHLVEAGEAHPVAVNPHPADNPGAVTLKARAAHLRTFRALLGLAVVAELVSC